MWVKPILQFLIHCLLVILTAYHTKYTKIFTIYSTIYSLFINLSTIYNESCGR